MLGPGEIRDHYHQHVFEMGGEFEPGFSSRRLAVWILVALVALVLVSVIVFVNLASSADAAGNCGGG